EPAVVVRAAGVARDGAPAGEARGRPAVIDGQRDRRADAGAPALRGEDALAVVGEIRHLAVAARVEPREKTRAVRAGVGGAEADEIETAIVGDRADPFGGRSHGSSQCRGTPDRKSSMSPMPTDGLPMTTRAPEHLRSAAAEFVLPHPPRPHGELLVDGHGLGGQAALL